MKHEPPILLPWKTLNRRRIFAGGPVQELAIETIELPDGRIIADYYQIVLPDYVLIYAEMVDGTVPMLRQYKHGLRRVCLAFPGGAIESGESPLAAAQRELKEELGYVADRWQGLGAFVTNANQGCNTAHLFRATEVRQVATPRSGDLEDVLIEHFDRERLTTVDRIEEIGQATHVALLLLATDRVRYPATVSRNPT
jgi:ADP-ribose pyrophosphatase